MKRKILIGSIFAALLMLSMPIISTIQVQSTSSKTENDNECSLCTKSETINFRPWCILLGLLYNRYESLAISNEAKGNEVKAWFWHYWAEFIDYQMSLLNCPNEPDQ